MAWAIWQEICKRVHNQLNQWTEINIDWVSSLLNSFHCANTKCGLQANTAARIHGETSWRPPSPGQLRLDVDASFNHLNNSSSVGAVVRDINGFVWGAKAKIIRCPSSVVSAELEAIRFGMDFCSLQGFTNVCIFSDSLLAIRAVETQSENLGPEGAVAMEIRSLLESPKFVSIRHMRRSANRVAHFLAQKVCGSVLSFEYSIGSIPQWLADLVKLDCGF
ncbi:uncharacterized protein [Henckelia pumila]|uniref:uncharacterized protein n=1 Tax=Henckelia pumila TaxID=405737 RepID=UPI003C6E752F